MHDGGVAARLLEVVLARAAEARSERVTAVEVELGPDAPASAEALAFHWAEAARGTIAADAVLGFVPAADGAAIRALAIEVPEA
jgi:Zn finger protein HypA/HybF involved in hydrogenase expression